MQQENAIEMQTSYPHEKDRIGPNAHAESTQGKFQCNLMSEVISGTCNSVLFAASFPPSHEDIEFAFSVQQSIPFRCLEPSHGAGFLDYRVLLA